MFLPYPYCPTLGDQRFQPTRTTFQWLGAEAPCPGRPTPRDWPYLVWLELLPNASFVDHNIPSS